MIDLYLAQWFSKSLEKGASEEERADIDKAIGNLKKYEKVYNLMEYCSDLAYAARRLYNVLLKNANVPQAVYRFVSLLLKLERIFFSRGKSRRN